MIIFDALRRCYVQLKQYDAAIQLIQQMEQKKGTEIGLHALLGSLYVLRSDNSKAQRIWEEALERSPKSESAYRIVAGAMVQSRLFDQAIATYRKARSDLGNPNLFAIDLAYLYANLLNYAEATREYLKILLQDPSQLFFIQSRISGYIVNAQGLSSATTIVEESMKASQGGIVTLQLAAWLYMEGKQFERAYELYKAIDDRMRARGHEIFSFAVRSMHEGAYSISIKAFQYIINSYPNFDLAPQSYYYYAKVLEDSENETDTTRVFDHPQPLLLQVKKDSARSLVDAMAAYGVVMSRFPTTEFAARSLLQVAILNETKFFNLDAARADLEQLITTYPQYQAILDESVLRLTDVYVELSQLDAARKQLAQIATSSVPVSGPQENAVLKLAEIYYFQEKFDDALAELKLLTANPMSDVANDALSLQFLIQENLKSSHEALVNFARGDLLRRQRHFPQALQIYQETISRNKEGGIIAETLVRLGDVFTEMGRYEEAIAAYKRVIVDYPQDISVDRTIMKVGEVYDRGLKNKQSAVEAYKNLLEKYPNSIYASHARNRVRQLRGDTL